MVFERVLFFYFFCFHFGLSSLSFHVDQIFERADDGLPCTVRLVCTCLGTFYLGWETEPWVSPGCAGRSLSLSSSSVPVVSPFKYVIVLALSI